MFKKNEGKSSESYNLGLNKITDLDNWRADIVFVHGLGGDPYLTWNSQKKQSITEDNKNDFWPKWLGDALKCRIWSFGYDAKKFFIERGHAASRYDQARFLLQNLKNKDLGQQPIFFIAHSLGGLVVKEMLKIDQDESQETLTQVKGIVFLSTPHEGADLGTLAANLIGTTVSAKELEAHNAGLRQLDTWYRNHVGRLEIRTFSFYEMHRTWGVFVVDKNSANPKVTINDKEEQCVPVPTDHINIAKCESDKDYVFESVKDFIQEHLPLSENNNEDNNKDDRFIAIWHAFKNPETSNPIILFLGSGINLCNRKIIKKEVLNNFLLDEKTRNKLINKEHNDLRDAEKSSLSEIELASLLNQKIILLINEGVIKIDSTLPQEIKNDSESELDSKQELIEILRGLPCSICHRNSTNAPPGCIREFTQRGRKNNHIETGTCPLTIEQDLTVAKINVRFLSQFLNNAGTENPYKLVRKFYGYFRQPNKFHSYVAELIKQQSNKLPFPLIVTTNYDNFLEQALRKIGQHFSVIFYAYQGPEHKNSRFRYIADALNWQPGKPTELILDPNDNKYTREYFGWDNRLIIIKLYGSLEYLDSNFILTEDDHLQYVFDQPFKNIPTSLQTKILSKYIGILSLGYSMNDYDFRDILYQEYYHKPEIASQRQLYFIHQSTRLGDLKLTPLKNSNLHPIDTTLIHFLEEMKKEFSLELSQELINYV